MKILTIVVPTYNMEKYLSRCLDSMLINNSRKESLEILVVNDGSKDSSMSIAKDYEKKYPDIVKAIDKENGNYGSCVNRGLKEATGKYFRILDADDTFQMCALESMLNALPTTEEDMLVTRYSYLYDLTNERKRIEPKNVVYGKKYESFDVSLDDNDVILSMHAVTYKTTLLKDIALRLDEGVSYTDLEYVYFPQKYIKSLRFFDIDLYEYHIGREGQTVDPRSQAKSIKSFLTVTKRLVDDYVSDYKKSNPIVQNNERITINKIIYATFKIALVLCRKDKVNDKILKDIYKKIKHTDSSVLWLKKKKIRPVVFLWLLTGWYYSSIKAFLGK